MTGRRRKRRRSKRRKRMRVEGEGKDGKEEKRGGRSICGSRRSSRRRGGRSLFLRIRLSMGVHYGPHVTACTANKNRKSNKNFRLPNANQRAAETATSRIASNSPRPWMRICTRTTILQGRRLAQQEINYFSGQGGSMVTDQSVNMKFWVRIRHNLLKPVPMQLSNQQGRRW